ncbi:MAG: hypothetical protein V8R80_00350, partial [Eubacterium sp.]
MLVLSGMSSIEQMKDNLSYMEHMEKISEKEQKVIDEAVRLINAGIEIPCTACSRTCRTSG